MINLSELTKLKSLSVIDCPKLTTLDCSSTKLTELEVNDLIELNCSNTLIKELSLNLCPNIKKLNCSNNNELISLNVSNCKKLKYLDCSKSKLTSLDLSYCPTSIVVKKPPEAITTREKEQFRNILIVGRTGGGKSTLSNVLTDTNDFKESAYAVSETKGFRTRDFTWKEINYRVVDTIGVGDTKLDTKSVLYKIADGILSMPEGISQVLFVAHGRFTKEEVNAFDTIKNSVFTKDILGYVTIVKTKFSNFRTKKECEADKKKIFEEDGKPAEIIKSCNDIIYVDNPSTNITDDDSDREEKMMVHSSARKKSRQILLDYLEKVCQRGYFKLETWDELRDRILKYINDHSEDIQRRVEDDAELEAVVNASKEICLIL